MRFHACWLLADEADAGAIRASVTTGGRPLTDWPHLAVREVDGMDVNALERLVRPRRRGERPAVGGKLLCKGKTTDEPFVSVSRVEPAFVQGLAALGESDLDALGETWVGKLENADPPAVKDLLRRMAAFARQAGEAGRPVLQVDVV
jgi:hypothetical protein